MRIAERVLPTHDPRASLASTELVIVAVPCQYLRRAWEPLVAFVPPDAQLCSVIKGIETSTLQRPSAILREYCPDATISVLSGPSIAPEIARCLPATVVLAADVVETAEPLRAVLNTSWFRVYTNSDVLGVEIAGALKNVIAIAAGILDGLRAGDNAKAALLTRGLVEITRLGVALGARPGTFWGLAGVGDLVTTCVSPMGRNRTAGERIGSGTDVATVIAESTSVIEGIPTTRAVLDIAERENVVMPITHAVAEVLFAGKPPIEAITELMTRPPRAEDEF